MFVKAFNKCIQHILLYVLKKEHIAFCAYISVSKCVSGGRLILKASFHQNDVQV